MDIDKGLGRVLPPLEPEEEQMEQADIDEHNL